MKKEKKGFIEWNSSILVGSLKAIGLEIFLIVLLDALFYVISGYLFIFWMQRVQSKMASFNIPADLMSMGAERAGQVVVDIKAFYYTVLFSFILLLLAIIFLAAISKAIIWAKTTRVKISLRLISRFMVLNLMWMGFWLLLILAASILVEPASAPFFMAGIAVIGLYFTNILYPIFIKTQEYKSIATAARLGISSMHLFILPNALALLLLYVILKVAGLVHFSQSAILAFILVLLYAAAARYYFAGLAYSVSR